MPSLLKIDVSPRGEASYSRRLGAVFQKNWIAAHPNGTVVERDLSEDQPTFVDLQWIGGAYAPPDQLTAAHRQALRFSDKYIAEIHEADHILITTPMYNFQTPAVLKAWIDHVVRINVTVERAESGYVGLLRDKKVTVIIASATRYDKGAPHENADFLSPYLKFILAFIGITDVSIVGAGGNAAIQHGKITEQQYLESFEGSVALLARML